MWREIVISGLPLLRHHQITVLPFSQPWLYSFIQCRWVDIGQIKVFLGFVANQFMRTAGKSHAYISTSQEIKQPFSDVSLEMTIKLKNTNKVESVSLINN